MKIDKRKCICRKILCVKESESLYVHLSGCPEGYYAKEYYQLPWYKRLFWTSPEELYY